MKNWIRRHLLALFIAFSSVGKKLNSSKEERLESGDELSQSKEQGSLSHALRNGIVNQQVQEFRARIYEVLDRAQNFSIDNEPIFDENGEIITMVASSKDRNVEAIPSTVKGDPFDDYPVMLVVDNTPITLGAEEAATYIEDVEKGMSSKFKFHNENPIMVGRSFVAKDRVEQYAKRLFVRTIDGDKKLLEFYLNKYKTENKKHNFFLNSLIKFVNRPMNNDFLKFETIDFITYNTLGSKDFRLYSFNNIVFNKVVEYDGNYILKYTADIVDNGVDILEDMKKDLSEDYKNKTERQKIDININPEDFYKNGEFFDNLK